MKNVIIIAGFVLALIVIGASSLAQEKRNDKGHGHPEPEKVMERFDTDKNGSLNKTEVKAMHDKKAEKMAEKGKEMKEGKSLYDHFEEADLDNSGELSLEELKENMAKHGKEGHNFMEKFDKNADGKLDKSEAKIAKEEREAKMAQHEAKMKSRSLYARFETIDSDHDGHITGTELLAEKAKQPKKEGEKPKHQPTGEEMVKRFDTNGNGTVEKDEAKAHDDEKKAKMEERKKHNIYDDFDEIDSNSDGFLTEDELRAFKEKKKAERQAKEKK